MARDFLESFAACRQALLLSARMACRFSTVESDPFIMVAVSCDTWWPSYRFGLVNEFDPPSTDKHVNALGT